MYGSTGADRYVVSGTDYITDAGTTGDGDDTVVLPTGVRIGDLRLERVPGGDLLLSWGSRSVRIANGLDLRSAVERIAFSDGTSIRLDSLAFVTNGTNAADLIYGNLEELGSRNDTMRGLDGDDRIYGY